MLTCSITKEEKRVAVWQCESTRSLGRMIFNFGFIKQHWEVIKKEVKKVV